MVSLLHKNAKDHLPVTPPTHRCTFQPQQLTDDCMCWMHGRPCIYVYMPSTNLWQPIKACMDTGILLCIDWVACICIYMYLCMYIYIRFSIPYYLAGRSCCLGAVAGRYKEGTVYGRLVLGSSYITYRYTYTPTYIIFIHDCIHMYIYIYIHVRPVL